MDKEKIFKAASELYHIPIDMIKKVYDVETLDEEEAEDIYGDELEDIEDAAEKMGLNWYKEAKRKAERTIQITEQDIHKMVSECVKAILRENDFSNGLDRIRSSFYIKGKKKGLKGEELDNYVQEHFGDFMAKDAALNDFRSDLRKEHPNHEEDDEFYGHSIEMADAPGFNDDFYYGDDDE